MKSYPTWAQVQADLGDKVLETIVEAVSLTRADLDAYRTAHPGWVADSSERGLANWIHDRLWANLSGLLDGMPNVQITDREPTREIWVGITYRLRVKRHHMDGHVSTYPTQTALDFLEQETTFEGMEEVHLIAGYEWDPEVRLMRETVISLRDGNENVIWHEYLTGPAGGAGTIPLPVVPTPIPPTVTDPARPQEKEQADSE